MSYVKDRNPRVAALLYGMGLDPERNWREWQGIHLLLDLRAGEIDEDRYVWCRAKLAASPTLDKWEQWYERAGDRPWVNAEEGDKARAAKKVRADRRSGAVSYDNARPGGEYEGPGQSALSEGPCCRDGFARLSLRRPFEWSRPAPPTSDEYMQRLYRLCDRCVERRRNAGAHRDDEDASYNRSLACGRHHGVIQTEDTAYWLGEAMIKE